MYHRHFNHYYHHYYHPIYSIDNGVMIAWAGIEKFNLGISDSIEEQDSVPRWPLGTVLSTSLKDAMK